MIKTLRITGIIAGAVAAGVVIFLLMGFFSNGLDEETEKLLNAPGIVEEFLKSMGEKVASGGDQTSPLVQQAKALALVLNPPAPPPPPPNPEDGQPRAIEQVEAQRVFSVKFNLMGTSFFESDPNKSFALISDPSVGLRWVKQGQEVDHFVFEQITDGMVVLRGGQGTQELKAVRPQRASLIKGEGPLPTVSAAAITPAERATSARDRITRRTLPQRTLPTPPAPAPAAELDEANVKLMDDFVEKMKAIQEGTATGTNGAVNDEEAARMMEDLMSGLKASRVSEEESQKLEELGQQLENEAGSATPAARGRRLPRPSPDANASAPEATPQE